MNKPGIEHKPFYLKLEGKPKGIDCSKFNSPNDKCYICKGNLALCNCDHTLVVNKLMKEAGLKAIRDTNKKQAIEDTTEAEKALENVSKWLNPEDAPINVDVLIKFRYRNSIHRTIAYLNPQKVWIEVGQIPLTSCEIIGWMYLPE